MVHLFCFLCFPASVGALTLKLYCAVIGLVGMQWVHDCCVVEGQSQDADDLTRVLEMFVV